MPQTAEGSKVYGHVNGLQFSWDGRDLVVTAADGTDLRARSLSLTLRPGSPPQLYLDVSPQK